MSKYQDCLRRLAAQRERKQQLLSKLNSLNARCAQLQQDVQRLDQQRIKEQDDVDKLEGGSLYGFFCRVIGREEQQLEKERREAYEAQVRFDAALRELNELEAERERVRQEYSAAEEDPKEYERLKQLRMEELRREDSTTASEIMRHEERINYLNNQLREINEAGDAGDRAVDCTRQVLNTLGSAETWGFLDVAGGGFFTTAIKHSKMDEAQRQIENLQVSLSRFRAELADVTVRLDCVQVQLDGFLHFADYFFDDFFVDFMVLDKIQRAKGQVQEVLRQLQLTLERLSKTYGDVQNEIEREQQALDALLVR